MAGEKLTKNEVDERINACFKLRFENDPPMLQREWVKYCKKHYNDKSEQQYCWYWAQAKEKYDETWRNKLEKMLDPAMQELYNLLGNEDSKIRQRAIDQVIKYSGNDIDKSEVKLDTNITLNWGDESSGDDA